MKLQQLLKVSSPFTYIYGACMILAGVLAVVENTIVLVALNQRKDRRKKKTDQFLMSLITSDMMYGYMVCTVDAYIMFNADKLESIDEVFIDIIQTILVHLVNVSTMSVLCLSYNRYLLLTRYKDYHSLVTKNKTRAMILISWMITAPLPLISHTNWIVYNIATSIFYLSFFVALSVFYFLILATVKKSKRQLMAYRQKYLSNSMPHEERMEAREVKLANRIKILLTWYIACFLISGGVVATGHFLVNPLKITNINHGHFFFLPTLICCMNSCINPVIYTRNSKEVRNLIRKLSLRKSISS